MDADTTHLMSLPRCGLPDVPPSDEPDQVRRKRFAHSNTKWENNDITYRIMNYSPDLTEAEINREISRALKLWSDVTPLTFTRVTSPPADILIRFVVFEHGDGFAFDGEGGTLAHAYFPGEGIGGDAHFDDHETFTVGTIEGEKAGTNLFMVAAHEFGHSLGLGHSSDLSALMVPFYLGYSADFQLSYDDLHGIQSLYGVNPEGPPVSATYTPVVAPGERPEEPQPEPKPEPTPDPDSDRCSKSFNAVAYIRGELFLFKGKNFWRMQQQGKPMEGYPVKIDSFWNGLPSKIDAAYERYDGKLLFFKGSDYWVYEGIDQVPGYPRQTYELGLPDDVDGALPWGRTGKTYFFKGEQYWRFDEYRKRVDHGYPKSIKANWLGVPHNIDAVFRYNDGYSWNTYFIRNRKYWRFDESRSQVDLGFPKSFSVDWMDCRPEEKEKVKGREEQFGELLDVRVTSPYVYTTDSGATIRASMSIHLLLLSTFFACIGKLFH
ncbi:matrix metalloproteinase-24-like [Diadema antillarum]|uniref:matrix metalloproteinase-24-like n=1 Tax=Diadema antillarum TaxID=105358 RepID=UPI003A87996B